jgi:hypothetical protein
MDAKDFVAKQFSERDVLKRAEEIFLNKKGNLTIEEFKNICVNVYFLSREDLNKEVFNNIEGGK